MTSPVQKLYAGVDIAEVPRVNRLLERYGDRFLNKLFTDGEQRFANRSPERLAARFAAKEAVMKALETGVRGIPWKSIEVDNKSGRAPHIELHGNAAKVATRLGIDQLTVSLSHSGQIAIAVVVAITNPKCDQCRS